MKYNAEIPNGWRECESGEIVTASCRVNWHGDNDYWTGISLVRHRMESPRGYRIIVPAEKLELRKEW